MSSLNSILRLISQPISRKGAARIFRKFPNSGCGNKFCVRTMSTMMKNNNSDVPSRISSPWLMLPPTFEGGDMVYNFYSLAEKEVLTFNKRDSKQESQEELPDDDAELVGSSHGWLALFNERNNDLFLSNPLSRRHIKLPPIHTLPLPEENLRGGYGCVSKVIISCSPHDQECRAMMIYHPENRLAFCRPGHSAEWTPIGALYSRKLKSARSYEDCVYSRRDKLFFCMTEMDSDDLEGWDVEDTASPRLVWSDEDLLNEKYHPWLEEEQESSEQKDLCRQLRCLVFAENSNQLFLVTRHLMEQVAPDGSYVEDDTPGSDDYPYKTIGFDVHKIDREGRKLSYMEGSLDGLAMFIGMNHSFAMPAAEFPELNPNCIYFTDDKELAPRKWVDDPFGGHDVGIFDYENRTLSPCYYPRDVKSIKRIHPAPLWFTPSPHKL